MYSALRVNGRRLYDMARAGKIVERKPRPVQVYDLDVMVAEATDISFSHNHAHALESSFQQKLNHAQFSLLPLPYFTIHLTCSGGTYVRTLIEDIGRAVHVRIFFLATVIIISYGCITHSIPIFNQM